jgi:UDP-N-acetylmuramoyl-L-alanyl-D-glutamate--2,6-diaminopimelate ligase
MEGQLHLTDLAETYRGHLDPEISGLTLDSRQVKDGWLFAALPGKNHDGCDYIDEAINNGAAAILAPAGVGAVIKEREGIAFVSYDNPRKAFSLVAAKYFGRQPDRIVAVTGTNGKTSTVNFMQQIWTALGDDAVSMGTIGVHGSAGGRIIDKKGGLTTPDPVSLYMDLAELYDAGVTHVSMEASSHGIHQYRLDGVRVYAAAFTNLSRDHLDYHGSMEDYFSSKVRLFSEILSEDGVAVLNADTDGFEELSAIVAGRNISSLSYGYRGEDITLLERNVTSAGQEALIRVMGVEHRVFLPLVGEFQLMNVLCAIGAVIAEAPDNEGRIKRIIDSVSTLNGVPGRLQPVPGLSDGKAVYIDYAHTPDALENVLNAVRPHTEGRLFCLMGCGGDRDAGKRPVMGRIATELADITIVADDNPRAEDPAAIRKEIMAGSDGAAELHEIGNRGEAIMWAVSELRENDVLVIAGKGHELGQIVGSEVLPFSDYEEACKAVTTNNGGVRLC